MKHTTHFDARFIIAGTACLASIATCSMIGTWIGIVGLVGMSILFLCSDPFKPHNGTVWLEPQAPDMIVMIMDEDDTVPTELLAQEMTENGVKGNLWNKALLLIGAIVLLSACSTAVAEDNKAPMPVVRIKILDASLKDGVWIPLRHTTWVQLTENEKRTLRYGDTVLFNPTEHKLTMDSTAMIGVIERKR